LTTSYGNETPYQSKTSTGSFSNVIYNLSPNTLYHFRAVAENDQGIDYGIDRTFMTSSSVNNPPTADAGPDREVFEGETVTLLGSGSDPDGDPLSYYCYYGNRQ